jgi:hypothetical protein
MVDTIITMKKRNKLIYATLFMDQKERLGFLSIIGLVMALISIGVPVLATTEFLKDPP